MNKAIAQGLKAAGVVGASALALVGPAHAALDAGITAAVTGAGTDGATLVGLLAAAGAACFLIYKLLKKFGVAL
jgi:hypothetical protein